MGFKEIKQEVIETWQNVKGHDKFLSGTVLAGGCVLLGTLVLSYSIQPKTNPKTAPKDAIKRDLRDIDGYLDPFPPIVEMKPEVREIIKYIEPEKEEIITYNPNDIFTFNTPEPKEIDPEDLKREMLQNARNPYTWTRDRKLYSPYGYETDFEDASRDLDFSAHKEPRVTPTFPVDLSRVLTADRFISAALITEIKSELPSQKVIAQVESDIFASHGRKILIPRGSRVIGGYEPLDETGATRIQIVWDRIITPDGINIKFDSETADQQGSSGITGKVDNRVKDRYAAALLFSTISAMAQLSVDAEDESQVAAAQAGTEEFGTLTAELLRNSLDILPRVTIERGTRVLISPLTDLWFKPATINEVQVVKLKKGDLR